MSWAYSNAAARRSVLYLAFRASMACWRSVLFSISWIRAYSLSYWASKELFTAAMPSAAATMAFSYTLALTSCPRASARATSASTLLRMVSKPSVSAAERWYFTSMASRVSMSSCRRILSFSVSILFWRFFRSLAISLSMASSVSIPPCSCSDTEVYPALSALSLREVSSSLVDAVRLLKESVHSLTISLVSFLPSDQTESRPFIQSRLLATSRVKSSLLMPKKDKP